MNIWDVGGLYAKFKFHDDPITQKTFFELYDVVILPTIVQAMAIGFKNEEIRRVITIGKMNSEQII